MNTHLTFILIRHYREYRDGTTCSDMAVCVSTITNLLHPLPRVDMQMHSSSALVFLVLRISGIYCDRVICDVRLKLLHSDQHGSFSLHDTTPLDD